MDHIVEKIIDGVKTKSPIYKITYILPEYQVDMDDDIIDISVEIKSVIWDYETWAFNNRLDEDTKQYNWARIISDTDKNLPTELFNNDCSCKFNIYCKKMSVELIN